MFCCVQVVPDDISDQHISYFQSTHCCSQFSSLVLQICSLPLSVCILRPTCCVMYVQMCGHLHFIVDAFLFFNLYNTVYRLFPCPQDQHLTSFNLHFMVYKLYHGTTNLQFTFSICILEPICYLIYQCNLHSDVDGFVCQIPTLSSI